MGQALRRGKKFPSPGTSMAISAQKMRSLDDVVERGKKWEKNLEKKRAVEPVSPTERGRSADERVFAFDKVKKGYFISGWEKKEKNDREGRIQ